MNVQVTLTGTSPLLMHNPRMVDPEFPINREIKALTGKRKKTDQDLQRIELLEWHGGLYTDDDGVVVQPTAKVRKCLIETARITKQGKQVERGLAFAALNVPLKYDGPKSADKLALDRRFISRLSVGIMGKRVMRVRPQFEPWSMQLDGMLIEDAGLNFDELERIVALAGQAIGIGDNRVNGYGRFTGEVVSV
jgi:hypothetical protein